MIPKEKVYTLLHTLDNTNDADEWVNIKNQLAEAKSKNKATSRDSGNKELKQKVKEHPEYALELEEFPDATGFMLSRNQRFVKKFMSSQTRNKSILLFHGVGVGKTCTSIHVAENMHNYESNMKRTLVISSKHLKRNFESNLYDISKRTNRTYESCVGNKYIKQIPNYQKMSTDELQKSLKKLIKLAYEFQGYQGFANALFKKKEVLSKDQFARHIHETFSNRVIIVDEVHNVRVNHSVNKKIPNILLDISLYASNVKLVYLSATPMYNEASEIIWLMNSLMQNNNVASGIIQKDNLWDDDTGELLPIVAQKISKFANRYVSYVRGENPTMFPARLWPSINKGDAHALTKKDYPKYDVYGEKIKKTNQLHGVELVRSDFSDTQYDAYKLLPYKGVIIEKDDLEEGEDADQQARIQISNVIYPGLDFHGQKGFGNVFEEIVENSNARIKTRSNEIPIFEPAHLKTYAPKIDTIVNFVNNAEGIVVIFSKYIHAGVLPIAMALEAQGYNRYNEKNLWTKTKENRGNYILLTGSDAYTSDKDRSKLVQLSKSVDNTDGDKVKVYIITNVVSEGYDFGNVREVHILEPWYNMNKIEQIIGRGVRFNSHINLPEAKRNTTIYLHCNMIPIAFTKHNRESVDFRMYRVSMMKQTQISKIDRLLKESAIDCNLNQEFSYFDPRQNKTTIITSQKREIKQHPIGDIENSKICDYQSCKYTCSPSLKIEPMAPDAPINSKLVGYEIDIYVRQIMRIFKTQKVYFLTYDQIQEHFKYKNVLKYALDKIVKEKIPLSIDDITGFIIYRSNKYIFNPINLKDSKSVLYSEYYKSVSKPRYINIQKIDKRVKVDDTLDVTTDKYNSYYSCINKFIDDVDDAIVYDMVVDDLTNQEQLTLIKSFTSTNSHLIESMRSSGIYYFDDAQKLVKFFDVVDDVIMLIQPGGTNKQQSGMETQKNINDFKVENESNLRKLTVKGYVEMGSKSSSSRFKIVNDKSNKPKHVQGSICDQSQYKKETIVDFIKGANSEFKLPKKYSKNDLCTYYQYYLRSTGNLLRPRLWKVYKAMIKN